MRYIGVFRCPGSHGGYSNIREDGEVFETLETAMESLRSRTQHVRGTDHVHYPIWSEDGLIAGREDGKTVDFPAVNNEAVIDLYPTEYISRPKSEGGGVWAVGDYISHRLTVGPRGGIQVER